MKPHSKSILALAVFSLVVAVFVTPSSRPAQAAGTWYVAPPPTGSDSSDCLTPSTPCATINGAIAKAASGDTIEVAVGTYTIGGVVSLISNVVLSGGWNESFVLQGGMSTLGCEGTHGGIVVYGGVTTTIERFIIQNCSKDGYGGAITNLGTMTLNNSTLRNNTAFSGAGILNEGEAALNNSTITGNSAYFQGGGIANDGTITLNNMTVSGNSATTIYGGAQGGGIDNYGAATLQNTIVAGNSSAGSSPNCYGSISSLGYNIIGDMSGCNFSSSTSDQISVDAGLFPLMDLPWYLLVPNSRAIDAGNPTGCTDAAGNPLIIDQRDTTRPLDGDGDGNARCDIGSYEFDPNNNPIKQVFLPLTTRDYCPTFFDDFSNSNSGWPVGEDDLVRVEYLGGEYRVLSKSGDYIYLFRAPACARQNYTVEMDARWVGGTGDSYGLLFGITSGFSQYYLFDMNTDYQMYRLLRRGSSGFTQVAPATYSSAIHGGTSSNHLKVTRNGSQITLAVNGATLGTWYDGGITGSTYVGLMSNPYIDVPVSDARFDNFSVSTLGATGAAVTATEQTSVTVQGNGPAATTLYTTLPPELDWKPPEYSIPQQPR